MDAIKMQDTANDNKAKESTKMHISQIQIQQCIIPLLFQRNVAILQARSQVMDLASAMDRNMARENVNKPFVSVLRNSTRNRY